MPMTTGTIECQSCWLQFHGDIWKDVEHHDGYGTRIEYFPEEDECPACRGEGDCETEKCPEEAATRWYEYEGGRELHGIYCAPCWERELAEIKAEEVAS